MIDNSTKEQIAAELIKYCDNEISDNRASKIIGISGAYISQIRNHKWSALSDDMWRKISNIIGFKLLDVSRHAETTQYQAFTGMFTDAKLHNNVYGITCQPGSGKTYTLDSFRRRNKEVFYAKCKMHTSEKELFREMLRSMGKNQAEGHIAPLLASIENVVERRESPVIIIDELEKVKDIVLLSIIDLYNAVENKCGIVLIGTPNLRNRVERGLSRDRIGFNELYSRIGGRFVDVPPPSKKDAAALVQAYGITDQAEISAIVNDSLTWDKTGYDLRRVERLISKNKRTKEDKAA